MERVTGIALIDHATTPATSAGQRVRESLLCPRSLTRYNEREPSEGVEGMGIEPERFQKLQDTLSGVLGPTPSHQELFRAGA